jgi:CRISPR-associated protein (TIGR02584 family)
MERHRILLCVCGLSPQIVTETIFALAVAQKKPWVPHKVRVLTTTRGAINAQAMLLAKPSGWFHRLCEDWKLPNIHFDASCVEVLKDSKGDPLEDILDDNDNNSAADSIAQVVRMLTLDENTEIHASIAGGRKTMGFFLGNAMSLWARPQDRLSHVLVSSPFEGRAEFYYPSPQKRLLPLGQGEKKRIDASKAQIWLGNIPFVRLRSILPKHLHSNKESFAQTVQSTNMALGDVQLEINPAKTTIRLNGVELALQPLQWSLLVLLAWRLHQKKPPMRAHLKQTDDPEWRTEVRHDLSVCLGEMNIPRSMYDHLVDNAPMDAVFSQQLSKLEKQIQKSNLCPWTPLIERVHPEGRNRQRGYQLALLSEQVVFTPIAKGTASLPKHRSGQGAFSI